MSRPGTTCALPTMDAVRGALLWLTYAPGWLDSLFYVIMVAFPVNVLGRRRTARVQCLVVSLQKPMLMVAACLLLYRPARGPSPWLARTTWNMTCVMHRFPGKHPGLAVRPFLTTPAAPTVATTSSSGSARDRL